MDLKGVIPLCISSINLILSPFVNISININNIVKLCVVAFCNLILFAQKFVKLCAVVFCNLIFFTCKLFYSAWNWFCSHIIQENSHKPVFCFTEYLVIIDQSIYKLTRNNKFITKGNFSERYMNIMNITLCKTSMKNFKNRILYSNEKGTLLKKLH